MRSNLIAPDMSRPKNKTSAFESFGRFSPG
nr:MAG TPA: hypothetical protein [Caudoviricetes sp.]